jgi:hypothetical protein
MPHRPQLALVLLTGIILASSACATAPDRDLTVHESERGAVYVERISDRSFQASHPIVVSTDMMARVLRGVVVKEGPGILGNQAAGKPVSTQAFGDEDVEFLAPLLAEGLTRAASDQQVGFRIIKTPSPNHSQSGLVFCLADVRSPGDCSSESLSSESTRGLLYASRQSLYLTLTEYRRKTAQGETINTTNQKIFNPTGLANRTVHFVPESARRPDSYRNTYSTNATLVIDYNLLATMPVTPDVPSTAFQLPTPVKGKSTQRDTDLDELRKELQDIKKKLAEQETERTRSTPSTPRP